MKPALCLIAGLLLLILCALLLPAEERRVLVDGIEE